MKWAALTLTAAAAAVSAAQPAAEAEVAFPVVTPGAQFAFPRDHGAHPDHRIEWWYFTGWLTTAEGKSLGFQITFFRTRPGVRASNPSAFAPRQILFAHAAVSDPTIKRLVHDQRIARTGFGLAGVADTDANLRLLDWTLQRAPGGTFHARTPAQGFGLDLSFRPRQPLMLNGEGGYSRKGPLAGQASYYYSVPHLAVSGTAVVNGRRVAVSGKGWLDREWSSTLLPPQAVGWDWTGLNLDDGSALMAFRVRGKDGASLHAGGTLRRPNGSQVALGVDDVRFVPKRLWRSPVTGASYPVEAAFIVRLPEGIRRFPLKPMFDAQELDGRAAGMPAYWEGAVSTSGGRGYLELTGYAGAIGL